MNTAVAAPVSLWPAEVEQQLKEWLVKFGAPDADLGNLLCDDHDPTAIAFHFVTVDEGIVDTESMTYAELRDRSCRLAAALRELGVAQGDRVAVLMGKRPELVVSLLALWRLGAVQVPLFTAFATPAIEMRLTGSGAKLIITEPDQRSKLEPLEAADATLRVIEAGPAWDRLVESHEPVADRVAVGGDAPMVVLFTSGTTGTPKGVVVPVKALASFVAYLVYGIDASSDDVYWNAADPGWGYGLYYGILGPLARGIPNVMLRNGFSAAATEAIVKTMRVTNFAAAPTVYRALKKDGFVPEGSLRRCSSAGEPLTPDVTAWAVQTLGTEVRDHYGQTEHGMMIINCWHDDVREEVREGSMGPAMPGFAAGTMDGQIVLDMHNSPLVWFTGYLDAPEKTAERFTEGGRWYLTGDTGREEEGHFYFSSRDDDVIIMAGYRIGPFEVESVLTQHPEVAEAAVVGKPDELRGEVLEAYVVLNVPHPDHAALERELQQLVKDQYAAHAYPRRVHVLDALPKTPSGKVQRFLLRNS